MGVKICWHGCASFSLRMYGQEFLFDPYFLPLGTHVPGRLPNGNAPAPAQYVRAHWPDLCLITGGRYEHCDVETVRRLGMMRPQLRFLAGDEVVGLVRRSCALPDACAWRTEVGDVHHLGTVRVETLGGTLGDGTLGGVDGGAETAGGGADEGTLGGVGGGVGGGTLGRVGGGAETAGGGASSAYGERGAGGPPDSGASSTYGERGAGGRRRAPDGGAFRDTRPTGGAPDDVDPTGGGRPPAGGGARHFPAWSGDEHRPPGGLPLSFRMTAQRDRVYVSGDTALTGVPQLDATVAVLCVGGPGAGAWNEGYDEAAHPPILGGDDIVTALRRLSARVLVPIHWDYGGFAAPFDIRELQRRLAEEMPAVSVIVPPYNEWIEVES